MALFSAPPPLTLNVLGTFMIVHCHPRTTIPIVRSDSHKLNSGLVKGKNVRRGTVILTKDAGPWCCPLETQHTPD